MATDDDNHRIILDRANRMLRQSKVLRKMSDELLQEGKDLRATGKDLKRKKLRKRR